MMLDLASSTTDEVVNEWNFRQLLYFNQDVQGLEWVPNSASVDTWRRWRLIQLRDCVVTALNGLFVDFSRWGVDTGGTIRPLNLDDYVERVNAMDLSLYLDGAGRLDSTPIANVVDEIDHQLRNQGWPMSGPLHTFSVTEHHLTSMHQWGTHPDSPMLTSLALLVAWRRHMHVRGEQEFSPQELRMFRDRGDGRRSISDVFFWLERRVDQGGACHELVIDLLREVIIRDHLRTARGKLPENTFRFYDEPEGYRFVDHGDTGIRSISIRFNAISQAMSGLGLIAAPLTEEGHEPTELGLVELDD